MKFFCYKVGLVASIICLQSCCTYLPIIDYPIILDFNKKEYNLSSKYLINTDSLVIRLTADTYIPEKCRSKKLKEFYSTIQLSVDQNLYRDSLVLALNANQVTCTDGKNIIRGQIKSLNDAGKLYLVIKKEEFFLVQKSYKTNSLMYDFDYSGVKNFNYKNQILKINLGDFELSNGRAVKTEEVVGMYMEKL
jgi:hypothetical protein